MSREDGLRAELARTRSEMLALLAVNQTLRVSRDLSTLYRVVASQLANVIRFDSLFIALYVPEADRIREEFHNSKLITQNSARVDRTISSASSISPTSMP